MFWYRDIHRVKWILFDDKIVMQGTVWITSADSMAVRGNTIAIGRCPYGKEGGEYLWTVR